MFLLFPLPSSLAEAEQRQAGTRARTALRGPKGRRPCLRVL